MRGVIVSFRRGRKTQYKRQMIIKIGGEASSYIGKSVVWTSPGKKKKEIKGTISALHGHNGNVRVVFERGLPGESIGTEVNIVK